MNWTTKQILDILDTCAEEFTFPSLDNGYVYLGATRLSLYRQDPEWAIVIEVFGFSPRAGQPDISIYTFSSKLHNRDPLTNYESKQAYEQYLQYNAYNEFRSAYPIKNHDWQHDEDPEHIKPQGICLLRNMEVTLPDVKEYERMGIELEEEQPFTFEFSRYLAEKYRDKVLCTEAERRVSVLPEMTLVLQLDEWHHPDVIGAQLPSSTDAFQQFAKVLITGDPKWYTADEPANTHWSHWPEGGSL